MFKPSGCHGKQERASFWGVKLKLAKRNIYMYLEKEPINRKMSQNTMFLEFDFSYVYQLSDQELWIKGS